MSEDASKLRTWFAGEAAPEDSESARDDRILIALAALIFAVLSPVLTLVVLACRFAFTKGRIHFSVFGIFGGIISLIMLITNSLSRVVSLYGSSFQHFLTKISENDGVTFGAIVGSYVTAAIRQAPFAIPLGFLIGFVLCWYMWIRRPVWKTTQFRLTPWQWYRRKQNIKAIQEDRKSPNHGATIGVNQAGDKVLQKDEESAMHTFIPGASGSGKTTTMMLQARDHVRRGHPLIFIDLKGGSDVPSILHEYAERYGRKFYHWQILDRNEPYSGPSETGPSYYDPLSRGDASRRKDIVIAGRKWTEDYYKGIASSYLQTAFNVAIASPPEVEGDSITDLISLLNPKNLQTRANKMPTGGYYDEIREYVREWQGNLDTGSRSAISSILRDLQNLKGSSAGQWLRRPAENSKGEMINLQEIAYSDSIVVFSLDSLNYEHLAPLVANFIIQDLKTVTSSLLREKSDTPLHVYIDEFSAIDSANIINLVNKAREAGVHVTLATQALGDLKKIDPTFVDQFIGNINCFIIHRANVDDDLEVYAGLTGRTLKWRAIYGVEHTSAGLLGGVGKGAATGHGSVREVDDYNVSAQEIQDLTRGQAYYVAMSPKRRIELVNVIPEKGKTVRDKETHSFPIANQSSNLNEEDYTNSDLPSLSPETEQPRIRQGLATPNPQQASTDNDTEETSPSTRPRNDRIVITPKPSTGIVNGKDLKAALRGNKTTTPETQSSSSPKKASEDEPPNLTPNPTNTPPSPSPKIPTTQLPSLPPRPSALPPPRSQRTQEEPPQKSAKASLPPLPTLPRPKPKTPPEDETAPRKKIAESWGDSL